MSNSIYTTQTNTNKRTFCLFVSQMEFDTYILNGILIETILKTETTLPQWYLYR